MEKKNKKENNPNEERVPSQLNFDIIYNSSKKEVDFECTSLKSVQERLLVYALTLKDLMETKERLEAEDIPLPEEFTEDLKAVTRILGGGIRAFREQLTTEKWGETTGPIGRMGEILKDIIEKLKDSHPDSKIELVGIDGKNAEGLEDFLKDLREGKLPGMTKSDENTDDKETPKKSKSKKSDSDGFKFD